LTLRTGGSSNAEEDSVGISGGGQRAGEEDSAEELHVKEKRDVMERVRKEGRFLGRKEVDDCQGGRKTFLGMGRRTYRSQLEKTGVDRVSFFSLWMRMREGGSTRVESKVKQVELSEEMGVALRAMKREDGSKEAPPLFSSASRIGSTHRVRRNDRDRNLLAGSGDQDGQNQGMMGVSEGQPLSHQGSPVRRLYPVPIEV
jgi:hypothetical protein